MAIPNSLTTHRHSQDVRELVCFCLPEAIPRVCDKNNWHHKLSLRVDQLLKRLSRGRDWHPSPDEHAINVEQQPEARLRLQEGRTNTGSIGHTVGKTFYIHNAVWIKKG